jgi:hypothetical protein
MKGFIHPTCVQATADAAGAGGAGQAQGADAGTSVTPPAGAVVAAASEQDGGAEARKSLISYSGAAAGDASGGGKATSEAAGTDAEAGASPAPVKIQLPDKMPDGVTLDKDYVSAFEKRAQEIGLDSDEATSIVDLYIEWEGKRVAQSARDMEEWSQEQAALIEKDPEVGGKNLAESKAAVAKALVRFGKPYGVSERLVALHLDNDPALFKMLAAVGRALSEDRAQVDTAAKPVMTTEEEREAKMFPSHAELRKRLSG